MPRRRSSEKSKFHQKLNIAFNPDPLNLAAVLCNKKDGTDSPEVHSPIVDRSNCFEPDIVQLFDINDPLNLNHIGDETLTRPVKRKKRRRNTGGTLDTEELKSIMYVGNKNGSLENPDNSTLISKQTVQKRSEIQQQRSDGNKLKNNIDGETDIRKCKHSQNKEITFSEKNRKYRYGNYTDYHGCLRRPMVDQRLNYFSKEWFEGKHCLDVGCNTGKVTILIAKHFMPSKIVGVDIDSKLIKIAKKKAQECNMFDRNMSKYPMSCRLIYGPIVGVNILKKSSHFPDNLTFHVENVVPESSDMLESVEPKYDCILCLNITKWIHLNFGDTGLKRFFKKLFLLLKPGGRLLIQPQSFASYKKKRNLMPETWKHYTEIKLMPTEFVAYLLSDEIGFAQSECLTFPRKGKIGCDRPLYLLVKSDLK